MSIQVGNALGLSQSIFFVLYWVYSVICKMIHKIENDYLSISIHSKGAELHSIVSKENQHEYLWNGDAKVWNRRSPILFPIVGRLVDNKYKYDGKEYSMSQHGFARDSFFEELFSSKTEITFILTESDYTLLQYPFQFVLFVTYKLEDKKIKVEYEVKNTNEKSAMYYSIGAHPGFVLHDETNSSIEDYLIEFANEEELKFHLLNGPYRTGEIKSFANISKTLKLDKETFKNDALIFNSLKSNSLILKNLKSKRALNFRWKNFSWMGIWSKYKTEKFICIEPWAGVCDLEGDVKLLTEKEAIENLNPKTSKTYEFEIEILN
ncbi:MAG: aldose 1-epimerase family protein [Cytophagales bacterium]